MATSIRKFGIRFSGGGDAARFVRRVADGDGSCDQCPGNCRSSGSSWARAPRMAGTIGPQVGMARWFRKKRAAQCRLLLTASGMGGFIAVPR